MFDLIVKNGTIVTPAGRVEADLAVRDGQVAAIGRGLGPAAEELDAAGLHVLPGVIDAHVHFRDPGLTHKEDFASGTLAAACGGVTAVFDMPNTSPPVATAEALRAKREAIEPKAHVDFGLFGVVLQENEAQLAPMGAEGAIGFKLFMGETTGNNPCPDDGVIYGAFRRIGELDLVAAVHAENNPILQRLKAELRATGRTDARAHLESRPPFVEAEAVARATTIGQAAGARVHVVHVSSAEGLAEVRAARRRGGRVTCEVLVSHLLLDDASYARLGNLVQVNPPVRERRHVEALWEGVVRGEVDLVATDHAPHTAEEQARENVWEGVGGFIGVETLLPLMLTQVQSGRLTLEHAVALLSEGPARVYGLYPRKGTLAIGADADFALVDLQARYALDQARLHSKHPVSPFHGWPVAGRVIATYLRGRAVVREGELVGPASGRMVRPGAG